jgi:hypothetical protein
MIVVVQDQDIFKVHYIYIAWRLQCTMLCVVYDLRELKVFLDSLLSDTCLNGHTL